MPKTLFTKEGLLFNAQPAHGGLCRAGLGDGQGVAGAQIGPDGCKYSIGTGFLSPRLAVEVAQFLVPTHGFLVRSLFFEQGSLPRFARCSDGRE
ncbi:MAG: hypothetical protein ACR2PR_08945 [Pseudohongiellaceae bacterium]